METAIVFDTNVYLNNLNDIKAVYATRSWPIIVPLAGSSVSALDATALDPRLSDTPHSSCHGDQWTEQVRCPLAHCKCTRGRTAIS